MCGFSQSTLVSTPVTVMYLLPSYSVAKPWCAKAGASKKNMRASASEPKTTNASLVFTGGPPEWSQDIGDEHNHAEALSSSISPMPLRCAASLPQLFPKLLDMFKGFIRLNAAIPLTQRLVRDGKREAMRSGMPGFGEHLGIFDRDFMNQIILRGAAIAFD